jgi:hypothetical protein
MTRAAYEVGPLPVPVDAHWALSGITPDLGGRELPVPTAHDV